jgi:ABC-type transport system involved in cytochrome bd biosynthesis fused ATPase/permease subunit
MMDQRCLAKRLSKFTERVENGLNTTIGEGGIKVSGEKTTTIMRSYFEIKTTFDEQPQH